MALQKSQQQLLSEIYDSPVAKFDYDGSGNLIYSGICTEFNQADNDGGWAIKRFYYDGSGNLIKVKKQIGVWDDRDTLDWGV